MANNFRITGSRYISKDGNDINVGSSPDSPRRTIAHISGVQGSYIIGSGTYYLNNNIAPSGVGAYDTFNGCCDGTVRIIFTNNRIFGDNLLGSHSVSFLPRPFSTTHVDPPPPTVRGTYFFYFDLATFTLTLSGLGGTAFDTLNVVLENGSMVRTNAAQILRFNNTVFKNISFLNIPTSNAGTPTPFVSNTNCTILNSSISYQSRGVNSNTITYNNCYVDETTTITMPDFAFDFNAGRFARNNFRGKIDVGGTLYELKKDKSGTLIPSRIANGIADLKDVPSLVGGDTAVYVTRANFAQDPEFINLAKNDYWSVASTSPNYVVNNRGFANIGNAKLQNTVAKADDINYFDIADSANGEILLTGNDFEFDVTSLIDQDSIPSKIIDLGQIMSLENITATIALAFNSDDVAGTANNIHVLQVIRTHIGASGATPLSAEDGANPQRLTFKMRWTKNSVMPSLASDWDNQKYFPAGSFQTFEINNGAKVSYDGSFYASGDPEFTPISSEFVRARYIQFELYINRGIDIT